MPTRRRRYTPEEKDRAIHMVDDNNRTVVSVARELGIGKGSLGAWVREFRERRRAEQWVAQVRPHFDFLTQHGFTLTDADGSSWWCVNAIYRSPHSAISVILSIEFDRVEIQLMRLVDGELPPYPIFVVDSEPLDVFYADDLLALRRPDADEILSHHHGLSTDQVEAQLAFWSSVVRDYGQDFLAGDLRVLDELERVVRDRARGNQVITVWLPEDATSEAEADALARARVTAPDGVTVTARRYRRRVQKAGGVLDGLPS